MPYSNPVSCIYKITSPSGKIYIGQTYNYQQRMVFYRNLLCKKQFKLYNSFVKYGVDNHVFEIIIRCDISELNELEKYYVDYYKCFNTKNGLNLKEGGGSNGRLSEESKLKISQGRLGEKHHLYGKRLPKEWREKISKSNKGKVVSDVTRKRLSVANKGRKLSDKHIAAISKIMTGQKGVLCRNSVPIMQYDCNGVFIKKWDCATDVNRELGFNSMNIGAVCRGERNRANGFIWRFEKDSFLTHKVYQLGDKLKKPLLQYTLNGVFIKRWDSSKEAALYFNISGNSISSSCKRNNGSSHGYLWMYENKDDIYRSKKNKDVAKLL